VREVLGSPDLDLCAVNLPDAKKGERIVLLLEAGQDADQVRGRLLASGSNPLLLPSEVYSVEAVPKLGSGKTDFAAARRLALALAEPAGAEPAAQAD